MKKALRALIGPFSGLIAAVCDFKWDKPSCKKIGLELAEFFKNRHVQIGVLFLLCLYFFLHGIGDYRLLDVDEPRYAEAAREMLKSGNWVTPYFNFDLRFDKPVFFYWLIAASYMFFGKVSEFAARFPSAMCATMLVMFVYYTGKKVRSHLFGMVSALLLMSSLEFLVLGRMSITDMTLSFMISATLLSGFLALNVKESNKKMLWWWTAYFFSALAVLTKGPVGFALPSVIFAVYAMLTGKFKDLFKPIHIIPGLAILFAVSVPWYYAIIKIHGMAFVNYFFFEHNLRRFSSTDLGHVQPFYFYLPVVFAGFFPWTAYLAYSMWTSCKELKDRFLEQKASATGIAYFEKANMRTSTLLFAVLWFAIVFLFFSASKAKLPTYVLPLFPALAIITAHLWTDYIEQGLKKTGIAVCTFITCVVCYVAAIAGIAAYFFLADSVDQLPVVPVAFLFMGFPVAILYYLFKDRRVETISVWVFMVLCILNLAVNSVFPLVYYSGPRDLYNYAAFVKYRNNAGPLYIYATMKPSVVFYTENKVTKINEADYAKLQSVLGSNNEALVIVKNRFFDDANVQKLKYHVVHRGKRYSLVSNKKIKNYSEME